MMTKVVKKCGLRHLPYSNFSSRLCFNRKHNVRRSFQKNKKIVVLSKNL